MFFVFSFQNMIDDDAPRALMAGGRKKKYASEISSVFPLIFDTDSKNFGPKIGKIRHQKIEILKFAIFSVEKNYCIKVTSQPALETNQCIQVTSQRAPEKKQCIKATSQRAPGKKLMYRKLRLSRLRKKINISKWRLSWLRKKIVYQSDVSARS